MDEQALPAMIQPATPIGLDALQTIVPFFSKEGQEFISMLRGAAETLQEEMVRQGRKIARLYSRQPGGTPWEGRTDLWTFAGISKEEACSQFAPQLTFLLESSQVLTAAS